MADVEDTDLFEKLKGWYRDDNQRFLDWWHGDGETDKGAEEDFRFRDGDQWSDDDKQSLMDQKRPILVFNRTGVLVDAVVGSEIGNRREVRFIPREQKDAKPDELLTSAAEWFRDQCDAEDEESEAFKDTVTAGMGWTETRLDFSENPQGDPKVEHFDPREARWDCNSFKANLVDTERRWRVRNIAIEEARELLPGVDDEELDASWADLDQTEDARHIDDGDRYSGDSKPEWGRSRKVTVVACQYFRKETYYRVLLMPPDGGQPQVVDLTADKYDIAQAMGAVLKSVKLSRKRVVQCFLGKSRVVKPPKPTQTGDFTWNCITGLKDQTRGVFYGIVRRAKDPQRWANKWLSQMMHILNSQAKGGIMAEEGVFEDQREAEAKWARPDGITILTKGALTNPNGARLQPKPVAQFPAGFDRLMQYADEAIIKATGINMELLGMRDANQPGVLEYQRRQSGIAILATFFDALRRYRKIQGRGMLHLIQNYLADGRMVRIVGDDEAQYVPLTKEAVTSLEYDVIVDDAPTSPNEKEKTWQLLQGMLPLFKDLIGPQQAILLAEYSPLPTSLIEKLKGMGQQMAQAQSPENNPALQIEQAKLQLEREKIDLERLKVQAETQRVQMELEGKQVDLQNNSIGQEADKLKAQADYIDAMAALYAAQNPKPEQVN